MTMETKWWEMARRAALVAVAACCVVGLTGCGGDDDDDQEVSSTEVLFENRTDNSFIVSVPYTGVGGNLHDYGDTLVLPYLEGKQYHVYNYNAGNDKDIYVHGGGRYEIYVDGDYWKVREF